MVNRLAELKLDQEHPEVLTKELEGVYSIFNLLCSRILMCNKHHEKGFLFHYRGFLSEIHSVRGRTKEIMILYGSSRLTLRNLYYRISCLKGAKLWCFCCVHCCKVSIKCFGM